MTSNVCHCSWPDCAQLHSTLKGILPSNHVWNGDSIRLEFGSNDFSKFGIKKYVLHKAVFKHCVIDNGSGKMLNKSNLYLRRHHYPKVLLIYQNENRIKQ